MTMPDSDRSISLEGAYNFRDIGGQATTAGRRMKKGLFFRSDNLARLSDQDLEKISSLHLRTIIDLRTPNEQKAKRDRIPGNQAIRAVSIPIYPTLEDPSRLKSLFWLISGKYRRVDFEQFAKELYLRIAFDHASQVGSLITLVSDKENLPVLIHCNGGKDRTGFMAALLQSLTGVSHNDIMHDYLLTNQRMAPYVSRFIRRSRWMNLFGFSPERMRPVLEARTEYLEEAFRSILERHESVEHYLSEACGVAPETLSRIRDLLLD
ncbi:MAG: hypothetical protein A2268_15780 [Candidatus Raymondbacteria bacterium RifOxyA12_full_50_37]|uniref:Tyrosine specific protein phosphatases domain-containing protein n=1 Tax=Candidatus Raymondbacteria bacterium RIFOXYD12_FULL_49_13 TaxID=1817890 RepID=A0A1F7FJE7_UNCRA|nr:MAG: hypothetical protein A2268_15780 [Candidatus Raymondbacteria bacterium RifOxyA12_full_50_37]OGJ87701.1 MAG: hypothetical protein A2248_07485 [Candidatus Raymondbacteria bacterium RIFOXYA2_FULL_49_16]OGJ96504.1 MAG: hypothetical protein A2453_00105 [Candidatus Raymondbacteria bacterium RIFOXYC2_FULL_50_21]OGJ99704.1 MAG: hypothetical protein A2487_18675 [Candidatus Raymondbacteria bacterium RifOxyC12_full_50_8]OGK06790.1 MAG: hypothetical protein A2519_00985 [Candidatus Raymondbacteria b